MAKVLASGKTPAGTHRPILVDEILRILSPEPGEIAVDCTLGFGGHAQALLSRLLPGGRLIGIDADPIELAKTETRLRNLGFGPGVFSAHRSNFAGLPQILALAGVTGADLLLADLGVSSMQLDDPARGFSVKHDGPLDMRMNPTRGPSASALLQKFSAEKLAALLHENADEPRAVEIARALAGKTFSTTAQLTRAVRDLFPNLNLDDRDLTVRRVFQALRISVNDEFSALDTFLRQLPDCLKSNGRAAILTFHSGEDRRVKKAFASGLASGLYTAISQEIVRPSAEECRANPRASSAKLRWARRGPVDHFDGPAMSPS